MPTKRLSKENAPLISSSKFRKQKKGCGGLRGEDPGAFPKAGSIFQQPFSLLENAETLAGIAFRAAGKSVNNFPAASKFAGKLFQQGLLDSHSLLRFSSFKWCRLLEHLFSQTLVP